MRKIIGMVTLVALLSACGGGGGSGTPAAGPTASVNSLTPGQQKAISSLPASYADPSESQDTLSSAKAFSPTIEGNTTNLLEYGSLVRNLLSNPFYLFPADQTKSLANKSSGSLSDSFTYDNPDGGSITFTISGQWTSTETTLTLSNVQMSMAFSNFVTTNYCAESVTLNGTFRLTEDGTITSTSTGGTVNLNGSITTPVELSIQAPDGTHTVAYNVTFSANGDMESDATWSMTGTVTVDGTAIDINDIDDIDPICED